MQKDTVDMLMRLHDAGISSEDALALRRCSMTLHRWHELAPFMVHHNYGRGLRGTVGHSADRTTRRRIPDREKGARKRIAAIVAKYPGLQAYVQGDPRGCALYILRPGDVPEGADVSSCYNRGIAVHK